MNDVEFWKLYLHEHSHSGTRWLHAIGTLSSWVLLFSALYFGYWWLVLLVPVVGFGMAWSAHVFIERNRPLSMRYPFRSLLADYRLTFRVLLFRPLECDPNDGTRTASPQ